MLDSCMLDKTRDLIQKKMNPSSQDGSFPQSFYEIYVKLEKWIDRFPNHQDSGIFNDLALLYLSAAKSYTEHRSPVHLFRLVAAIHVMQKKLFRKTTQPNDQQLEIKWIPTNLLFPFASKPVLGCLVGVNLIDRYELFDEENILLILQKHFPDLKLVKESSYLHPAQKKNHKLFYFEIEKNDGTIFSLKEQLLLKEILEEKIKNSIQRLTPAVFMRRNEEEVCKNILMLSQEITSIDDRPQAVISLEQQTAEEIIFLVTLVYIAPCPGVSLTEPVFITERQVPVKTFGDRLIEAHIFRIHLQRSPILLRSDGSLDFYFARQKAVALIRSAIGSFRDYNGGILIKLQEHLQLFKEDFADVDQELLEIYKRAGNFDTSFVSFRIFTDLKSPLKTEVISDFYEKWKNDKAVFNYWLGAQASSLTCTVSDLKKLMSVGGFDSKNPNHLRTVLCTFMANLGQYHDPKGEGYAFIVDQILTVSKFNSKVAHNDLTVSAFMDFENVPKKQQALMIREMKRLLSSAALPETRDLIQKMLEQTNE